MSIVKQDDLALLIWDDCWYHPDLGYGDSHTGAVNCFNQALHLPTVAGQERDVNGISNVARANFISNLNL